MKKLILKPNAVNKGEVLTRAQLKKVMGGNGSGEMGSNLEGGATKYKCVYPKGESVCLAYNSTPSCGKDVYGEQGILTAC